MNEIYPIVKRKSGWSERLSIAHGYYSNLFYATVYHVRTWNIYTVRVNIPQACVTKGWFEERHHALHGWPWPRRRNRHHCERSQYC